MVSKPRPIQRRRHPAGPATAGRQRSKTQRIHAVPLLVVERLLSPRSCPDIPRARQEIGRLGVLEEGVFLGGEHGRTSRRTADPDLFPRVQPVWHIEKRDGPCGFDERTVTGPFRYPSSLPIADGLDTVSI